MGTSLEASRNLGQAAKSSINIGDTAPDFTLPDQNRQVFHLAERLGESETVLYFYPKDFSQGCTKEACAFRDQFESFAEWGAKVVGVSGDSVESHSFFAARYKLPFTLLADTDGAIRKLYGVQKILGLLPGRVTFVIDRRGIVRHTFNSMGRIDGHVKEALRVLDEIQRESH
jgi:thioredoxin-dependent peroxiredoxin